MIKNFFFNHGLKYLFRLNTEKLSSLYKYKNLSLFLSNLCKTCPDDFFRNGSARASSFRRPLDADIFEIKGHEVNAIAKIATENKEKRRAHDCVESFFIERDKNTICTETPVWCTPFDKDAVSSCVITGHIDILRVENNRIGVWDYKPNAEKERFAATQTYLYARMLSSRTSIPLNNFICGYFDEERAYIFNPSKAKLV